MIMAQKSDEDVFVERYYREEIVSRALIEGFPVLAGIFAENRFSVYPDLICLEWRAYKFGRISDPAAMIRMSEEIFKKLGLPRFKLGVTEVYFG